MPRVHIVKKARVARPAHDIKVGDTYYWWKTRTTVGKSYYGQMHYSKTYPKPSQVTSNAFASAVCAIQEGFDGTFDTPDDVESQIDTAKEDLESLKSEQEEKLENMPEGLKEGNSGTMLQERIDAIDSTIQELEGIDVSFDSGDAKEDSDEYAELARNRAQEIVEEVQSVSWPS